MRFFVVGSGRCGTTLLWSMLNRHPDLFVFRETHWHPKLFEFFGLAPAPPAELIDVLERTCFIEGQPTTPLDDDLRALLLGLGARVTVARFSDALGQQLAARAGKSLWADKTPDYSACLGLLQLIFPRCRFVHLLRDGRAVARSMARHPGYRWMAAAGELSWLPGSFNGYHKVIEPADEMPLSSFASLWRRRIERARDEARRLLPGSYREFRHEDLLARPVEVLEQLADFVDIAADPAWLTAAGELPDPTRASRGAPIDVPLGPAELALQRELGYR